MEDDLKLAETMPEYLDLLGQRVGIKNTNQKEHLLYENVGLKHTQHVGAIRYVGKIFNNPKAGDSVWLGVEWDFDASQGGPGKHYGIVDGYKYFEPIFHPQYENQCCSFLRYGKVTIGGITIDQAIKDQYNPQDDLAEEEKQSIREKELQDLTVATNKKGGAKKIEIVGIDQSYNWRSNISNSRDITLQFLKISELGPPGTIRNLIPNTMHLHLDKNFLYSWDQFYQITSELRHLRVLTLTGNKFRKIDKNYFDGKNIDSMVHQHLSELVLIDMSLDWSQIDILSPTFIYVEQLYLVRNNCSKICSEFQINKSHFKNLRYLNLEQNGIESWDEVSGLRVLNDLTHLILNKNKIKDIYYKPGFKGLKYLSFDENLINDWKSFDQLDAFDCKIEQIRANGNPIMIEQDKELKRAKSIAISRLQFLKKYNGTKIEEYERKDFEIYYMKFAFETYLREVLKVEKEEDRTVMNIDDPELQKYMDENHPRFYQLVEMYGSPIEMVNLKKEVKNIAQGAAKLEFISECASTNGKTLNKKVLLTMTVSSLKAMCSKLFKVEVINQKLSYRGLEDTQEYPLDEDQRTLSFFSMADGGKIFVRD